MKIYITGSSGMAGSNICEQKPSNKYELLTPSHKEVDLLKYEEVLNFLQKNKPDFIIHTAGKVGGIQANQSNLYSFLMENTLMGLNLIKAAKEVGIKNLINLSSSCVYPKDAPSPLKEEMFLTGSLEPTNEGYAIAKNVVMKSCQYLSAQYKDFNYKTIVPVNMYGRHDKYGEHHSHMIPAVIKKIYNAVKNKEKTVEIWGTGNVRREFLLASDLARFIWYCIENFEKMPGVVNCSHGKDLTINEFYEKIAKVLGYKGEFTHNTKYPDGIYQKLTDNTKMKNFGWKPMTSFEDGVKEAFEFYETTLKK